MKRLLTGILALSMTIAMGACTPTAPPTGEVSEGENSAQGTSEGVTTSPEVIILTASAREKDANIIRDLLEKNGFTPIMNIQPDFASTTAVRETGEWDITVGAWTISPANPDYALRPLYMSGASANSGGLADPVLDQMINDASALQMEEAWDSYAEIERYMVEENAYVVPLYSKTRNQALNSALLNPESAPIYLTRSNGIISEYEYLDPANNDTRPLNMTSIESAFTSYWLPRHNETYSAYFTDNMYITLITRSLEGDLVTDYSLSYNYATKETNDTFYFILRDDVTYAKVEDGAAVDTGVIVSADDVVFSLMNAKDPNACPDQRIHDLYTDLDQVSIVTDLAELSDAKLQDGTSVLDALSEGLETPVASLTEVTDEVNNDEGVYQVVKVTTYQASPQILNYIANSTSGIYNRASVEAVMSQIDMENYNPDTDVVYGDRSVIMEGPNYDNHLWCSGPYIPIYQNEYEAMMERNPGYFPETDMAPNIKNVQMKFINNYDTAVAAFRSGEVDIISWIPENMHSVLENEPDVHFELVQALNTGFITFNQNPELGRIFSDVDARKAVLYSMDQDAFIASYEGKVFTAYSPISVLYDTPNTVDDDPAKVQEYLAAYLAK